MKTPPGIRLGITGGVGCGKSSAGKILSSLGWYVIDTDNTAKKLLQTDTEIIGAILSNWKVAADPSGGINRRLLADIVFSEPNALQRLNAIMHPKVRLAWRNEREAATNAGLPTAVIIPLLHEVDAAPEFDHTVCIACSESTQMQRLLQRGWNQHHATSRITSQFPLEKKSALSHSVIWNDGPFSSLASQIKKLCSILQKN